MSFKYFLGMAPEDDIIESSSLTNFHKLRLKNISLLDMLINKTVSIALDKDLIKSKSIIVDTTYFKARYNQKTPREILQEQTKKLRKTVYEIDETLKETFPSKNTIDTLKAEIAYSEKLVSTINSNKSIITYPKIKVILMQRLDIKVQTLYFLAIKHILQ